MQLSSDLSQISVLQHVDALRELLRCLKAGEPVPDDVSRLIARGLDECLAAIDAGSPASLDASLGLKRHGGVAAGKAVVNAERDRVLRYIYRLHPSWSKLPPAAASRAIHSEFTRYQTGRWKRDQRTSSGPPDQPFISFWRLLKLGSAMPSRERLRKILSLVIQDPV